MTGIAVNDDYGIIITIIMSNQKLIRIFTLVTASKPRSGQDQ
jgi:hypothetical protein